MESSNLVSRVSWIAVWASIGSAMVAVVGLLVLFSPGGQLMAAPALLPLQWWLGRYTKPPLASFFSLLGALLLFQALLLGVMIGIGDGASGVVVGVAAGLLGGLVFYTTSRRRD